ncbi:NAD(P)-binding protein [Aaosphaeria arxii CBS 175.79]|uniref:NAD(P)-binding protein n=1 Tax=Aaosphaeria arxii CBS 175.79 TaxID=1450172 RepID=A0A6A5Y4L0_9PLEO|nr:NAD(P)-binding protein [Aaosphaeria arxii CBS 175.79]KAF2020492.1 NAD(P)-binding protein [Aaosphaeria arxii CBS 175.79]
MSLRVIFTGGSGRIGRRVIRELVKAGHEVLNLDLIRLDDVDVHTMRCDLADSGQVFSCLNTYMRLGEPFPAYPPRIPDAVIHFAAMSTPMIVSDGETFRLNVMGTHNVIEAACKLGVKKLVIASSVTTYGVSFGQGHCEFPSFPIDEDLDVNPTDPYALSKVVGERIARSYAARFGMDIYCLRIGRVVEPEEIEDVFESYIYEPEKWYAHGWSYVDVRDLGQMCLNALQVSGLGYQIFNATNNSITNVTPTMDFLKLYYPHIPITRTLATFEAPISNRKIRELLGFEEKHDWRQYFTRWKQSLAT